MVCCFAFIQCKEKKKVLQVTYVQVDSLSQIVMIQDSLIKPIAYDHINGIATLPVPKAKKVFISAILPSILIAKHHISESQQRLHELLAKKKWDHEDSIFYNDLIKTYKASDVENLLLKLITVPNSIVLAQAAVESGWGQSRFFREANNIFGMWSYNSDEPRLRAFHKRKDSHVHVRAYHDYSQSIDDYFKTLATARAYRGLREALKSTQNIDELLPHLKYYSERRMDYVGQLKRIIDQNNLRKYDHYKIDPQYFVSP